MSRVLPDPLVGKFSPAAMRVHRALKSIPDDDLTAWASLPFPNLPPRPEFLLLLGKRPLLLGTSDLSSMAAERFLEGSLFEKREKKSLLAADDWRKLHDFRNATQKELRDRLGISTPLAGVLLFPNVDHAVLTATLGFGTEDNLPFLGREHLSPPALETHLRRLASADFELEAIIAIRARFTPESVVPLRFTPRGRIFRNTKAQLTPLLLDIDQEAWAKQRLRLSGEGTRIVEPSATESAETDGATLVTGVAGSGKSIVLLFRACAQARLEPACFSLFLTHNKALNGELKSRFREIGDPPNVHWHTFSSWCYQQLSTLGRVPKLIAYSERDRLIDETARAIWPAISSQWTRFLRDEYDWIQDHGLRTLDSYLVADRLGRGLALQTDRRTQVFAAYRRYRAELQRRTREDWSGLALRLWLEVEKKTLRLPLYDYIYVDEAQFFAPVWFHTLRAALAPSGKIFLAADPTQGFLKRRQSWTASGFDMRGRSTRLRRAYRNTRAILEFAAAFYRSRLKDEEIGDLNLPEKDELDSAPVGEKVRFLPVASRQDEVLRVANEIRAFLNGGGEAGAVLVLTALGKSTATVAAHLGRAIGADNVCDARYAAIGGKVRVCALDGATGLEAAIVFIVGLAELLESENDLQLPADQRMETVRDNTRRLYMAFTRAGLHLSITWPGVLPQWAEFAGENPDQESLGHRRTCASR